MATKHKIIAERSGSYNGMDWEAEYEITFEYRPGRPAVMYLRNGDPGYPADPPEIELVSVKPTIGIVDAGGFTDLAQKDIEEWASEWIQDAGYDAAMEVVASDSDVALDYAADLRADR